jgi:regulator of RNase E activity RraB
MILHSGLIFNRFGVEEEITKQSNTGDYVTLNKLDGELLKLQDDFKAGAKQIFTKIEDHVKKTEELLKTISVDKNYISVNNKRIVSASRAINKNDVVIKSQLENMVKISTDLINKRITDHVEIFDKFKVTYDDHIKKYRDHLAEYTRLKTHIGEEIQDILEKQKLHNDRIAVLESKH